MIEAKLLTSPFSCIQRCMNAALMKTRACCDQSVSLQCILSPWREEDSSKSKSEAETKCGCGELFEVEVCIFQPITLLEWPQGCTSTNISVSVYHCCPLYLNQPRSMTPNGWSSFCKICFYGPDCTAKHTSYLYSKVSASAISIILLDIVNVCNNEAKLPLVLRTLTSRAQRTM